MSTIEQIRDNAARANDMIKQLSTPAADSTVDAADPADAPAAPAAVDAPAPAPVAAPVPSAPAAVTTAAEDENSESFAQRWRSLQGVFASTKDRLRESEEARQNLEQLVAQMQAARTAPPSQKPKSHLTEKDQGEYGGDMVDFVRRAARDEMAPLAQAVRGIAAQLAELRKLAPAVESVAAAQVAYTQDSFYADLTRQVPNWRAINSNTDFHKWLLEYDGFSGFQRDTLLKDAHDRFDLDRVVNIFRSFAQASGAPAAASAAAPSASPAAPAETPQDRLARQVAPGRVAGTAPPAAKAGRQWTREQITKFYADKRNGLFRGKKDEATAMERDIFAAQRDGRIALS